MFRADGDQVQITLSRSEFDALLLYLGFAAGAALRHKNDDFFFGIMRITNEINEGNPNFTPYEVPEYVR